MSREDRSFSLVPDDNIHISMLSSDKKPKKSTSKRRSKNRSKRRPKSKLRLKNIQKTNGEN